MEENTKQNHKIIGIEVKREKIIAVSLAENGEIIDSLDVSLDSSENIAPQLVDFVSEAKREFGDFEKMGVAVPGLFNRETNKIDYSTRIPEHAEIDLLSELEKVTKLKIYIENDANAAAFGEHILGAGRGSKDLFYATLGVGIGGALIFNDKLWYGSSGFAGEFGHIAINSEGMKLEDVTSTANILRRTRNWFHKDTTSSLYEIGEDNITISDVVREAKKEDGFAQLMLQRTGTYVGTAIAGVINLLNIDKIVIGGEIMEAGNLVLDAIIHRARELSFTPSFRTVDIVAGELGENAGAIGAALLSDRSI